MHITNFELVERNIIERNRRSRVVIVMATDPTTRGAIFRALKAGFVEAIFVGSRADVESDDTLRPYSANITIIDAIDADDACRKGVSLIHDGAADVLMKGLVNTDNLLRAILDKNVGILAKGDVLTHVTVAQIPKYHKLLMFTDAAVIPYPTDDQRAAQLRYVVDLAHKMGVQCPRVALIHCSEKPDPRHFPFTENYMSLKADAAAGKYGDCIVDGPLDVKTACSKAALEKKGLESAVDGDADVLIFPDIEAGNTFYKSITLFGDAIMSGMLCGCSAPVVLPSRGDSVESKYNSLIFAALCGGL